MVIKAVVFVLVMLFAHDFLLYKIMQRRALAEVTACAHDSMAEVVRKAPKASIEYYKNFEGAVIMDCHNGLVMKYLYPADAEVKFSYGTKGRAN